MQLPIEGRRARLCRLGHGHNAELLQQPRIITVTPVLHKVAIGYPKAFSHPSRLPRSCASQAAQAALVISMAFKMSFV